jgi:ABC-2 type transport system permease protein
MNKPRPLESVPPFEPPVPGLARAAALSLRRIGGVLLRHLYVLRRSWPRILELAYWPLMQMILWGFITVFFREHSSWVAQATGVLITAVLLWDVLFRANLGVAVPFIEEMWARNLAQLFVSPLRPGELVTALLSMSLIRTLISLVPAAILAWPLYDVWVFQMGLPLLAFFANLLVMGWSVGLIASAIVLRAGLGAESLAWLGVFMLAPVSGVYYPISVLPDWLQVVAWALPAGHVFEGMRAVLFDGVFRWDHLAAAVALNGLYLALAIGLFLFMFRKARIAGSLLQQGE